MFSVRLRDRTPSKGVKMRMTFIVAAIASVVLGLSTPASADDFGKTAWCLENDFLDAT